MSKLGYPRMVPHPDGPTKPEVRVLSEEAHLALNPKDHEEQLAQLPQPPLSIIELTAKIREECAQIVESASEGETKQEIANKIRGVLAAPAAISADPLDTF